MNIIPIVTDGTNKMRCMIDVPEGVNLPLLVFLHGIGENGTNLERVLKYGPLAQLKAGVNIGESRVTVHPQNTGSTWGSGEIDEVIEYCKKTYPVDPDRIYLMGASLGGYGVWTYAQYPDYVKKLACIIPICAGGNDPSKAGIIAADGVPGWAAHAFNDPTVSYSIGKRMVVAVNEAAKRSQIRFTEVGLSGHTIWTNFLKPEHGVYEWMKLQRLSHRKNTDLESLKAKVIECVKAIN